MTRTLHAPVELRTVMRRLARNPVLPTWVRVGCYAWAKADPTTGHATLATSELRRHLHASPQQISEAIARAKTRSWIDPTSSARCLVLPGFGDNPCEEHHP